MAVAHQEVQNSAPGEAWKDCPLFHVYLLRNGGAGRWCTARLPSQPVPRASGATMLRPRYKSPSPSSSSALFSFFFFTTLYLIFAKKASIFGTSLRTDLCRKAQIFGNFPDLPDQLFVDRLASAQVFEEELFAALQRFMSCFDPPTRLELAAVGLCARCEVPPVALFDCSVFLPQPCLRRMYLMRVCLPVSTYAGWSRLAREGFRVDGEEQLCRDGRSGG